MTEQTGGGSADTRVRRFLRRGAGSRTARNTSWLAGSSILNGLLGAIASAVLARTLGIDGFGTYMLLLALANLLTDLSDAGLGSTLVRFGAESLARNDRGAVERLVRVIFRLRLAAGSVVIGLALLTLRPLLGGLFGHVHAHLEAYAFIAVAAAAAGIPAAVFPPLFQATGDFRSNAVSLVLRSGTRLALLLLLVIAGTVTVPAALWIDVASILVLLWYSSRVSTFRVSGRLSAEPEAVRSVLRFARWVALQQIITLLGTRLDVFVVGGLTDAHTLGIYGAAARIAGLLIAVTNSYYTVLLAEISSISGSPDAVARKRRVAIGVVTAISAGILLLVLLADPVVSLLYGPEFGESSLVLQIMFLGVIATVSAYPLQAVLYAERRMVVFPVMALLSAAGMIAGNIVLLPRFGAAGGAAAFAASSALGLLAAAVTYAATRRTR